MKIGADDDDDKYLIFGVAVSISILSHLYRLPSSYSMIDHGWVTNQCNTASPLCMQQGQTMIRSLIPTKAIQSSSRSKKKPTAPRMSSKSTKAIFTMGARRRIPIIRRRRRRGRKSKITPFRKGKSLRSPS